MGLRVNRVVLAVFAVLIIAVLAGCENPLSFNRVSADGVVSRSVAAAETEDSAAQPTVINEFVFNHTGTDVNEYVEVFAEPGTDMSGLTLLEIEGDSTSAGYIDGVLPVGVLDAAGYWTTGFLSNEFENGTVTLLLVSGFSGQAGEDLDTDNDGILDSTPWSDIVDSVAVSDGGSSDRAYSSVVLEPYFDGNPYGPGGASRIPNGEDYDSISDWVRNDFGLIGLPGVIGDPMSGQAYNTPGEENRAAGEAGKLELSIPEIQGSGIASPYAGSMVFTTGVVTLMTNDGRSFWLQDVEGDGDSATSDGVFVYHGGDKADVAVGDLVNVYGRVVEYVTYSRPGDLPLTEISPAVEVTIRESDVALPQPVRVSRLPDRSILEGIAFYEALEGMLVSVDAGPVVGPTNGYGEFVMLTRANARPGSGFVPELSQVLVNNFGGAIDYNPERIMVDDTTLDAQYDLFPGDFVRKLVGVLDYNYSSYKIEPATLEVSQTGRRPRGSAFLHHGDSGIEIATFNVENLFDLLDEPGKDDGGSTPSASELETKLAKLTMAFVKEIHTPEIVVVEEVENQAILQVLADRVNAAAGTAYQAVSFETSDVRGIEVGFMYDTRRVELADAYQLAGPDVDAAFGASSDSPGRKPIVGVFDIGRMQVTVIGNHFKSKGGDDPLYGVNWPPLRPTEEQRKLQARVVRDFVNTILAADHRAKIVVTGDLNDFPYAEPGEGSDDPVSILKGVEGEVPMTNLMDTVARRDAFTYVYDGNSQILDHMLVSPALRALRPRIDVAHFNASVPESYADDPATAWRSSDHDPVIMSLQSRHGR